MNGEILEFLKINDVEYKENLRLSKISPVRIGAEAFCVAYPNSVEKVINVVDFLENNNIKHKILGRMSNVLPPDNFYDGVIIRCDKLCHYSIKDHIIKAESGISMPTLASLAMRNSLSGLEALSGIPGSLGGAIYQNAGAFGASVSDVIESVRVYDIKNKSIYEINNRECAFGYRNSVYNSKRYLILGAKITLAHGNFDNILHLSESFSKRRRESQPINLPSLGSVFKMTDGGISAARLMDECGLKGLRIGGASISTKHAGFIVNDGGATSQDFVALTQIVKKRVMDRFGIELECEIELL